MKAERRDFLLEIGTEELPPRSLHALQQALVTALSAGLARADLAHGELVGFATPRRLAVWVKRLAAQQPEQHLKRRGPPLSAAFDAAGQPTRAALGFAESCGTSLEALQRLDEGKGTFLFFLGTKAGERAVVLLPGLVRAALDALPIARRMHWGAGSRAPDPTSARCASAGTCWPTSRGGASASVRRSRRRRPRRRAVR